MTGGVSLHRVGRSFDAGIEVRALDEITAEIDARSITALVGPSGSGKTTLLNIIAGLDQPTEGTVKVFGQELSAGDDAITQWRRNNVAFIFQAKGLVSHLTALENIDLALRLVGRGRTERRAAATGMLDRVGLAEFGDHRPSELSGGQQQRVAIARALVVDAPLLIADEPTGELDSETAEQMTALILESVAAAGTTALIGTHDQTLEHAAHRVLRLVDGRLAAGDEA